MTLDFFQCFNQRIQSTPNQIALQYADEKGSQSFTYSQIHQEASKIGIFLQQQGIGPGDAVGILMENHPRWGIAFLAAQSAGARIVPFDVLHNAETLAQLIQHAQCKFLISSETFTSKLEEIQALLSQPLPNIIAGHTSNQRSSWDQALQQIQEIPQFPLVPTNLDDPFVVIYTSGTTGNPKGVVLTQRGLYQNAIAIANVVNANSSDHVLSVLPLYHVLALMVNFIIPLYRGFPVTYLDSLDGQKILQTFQDENITIFVCVPQFYYLIHNKILQQIDNQSFFKKLLFKNFVKLSRFCIHHLGYSPGKLIFSAIHKPFGEKFRLFGVGGAHFDPVIAEFFRDIGFTIVQAYGMTETSAVATMTHLDDRQVGSVGPPLPHVQLRIDQPDKDGIGSILIQGQNIMSGYWENSKATQEVIQNDWLDSGDLGYINSDGYLHITGRKKDVIVLSSGKNIFPEELEHFYQSNCPYIKEMCILGVQDRTSREERERLHATIVPDFDYMKTQQTINTQDMLRYWLDSLSKQLPSYKRVGSFEVRQEPLPRTTTRKIKRFQVNEELQLTASTDSSSRFEKSSIPETSEETMIFQMIQQMKHSPSIHKEMNLELDLGFDSLQRVELLTSVQNSLEIQISDEIATEIFTVEDLIRAVESGRQNNTFQDGAAPISWKEILQEPLRPEDRKKVEEILKPRPITSLAFYLTAKITYLLTRILFRLKVNGLEHLPQTYPYLICPNHLSFLDAFMLVAPLPYRIIKRIFFLGYADYFNRPGMFLIARLIKVVPVDPDSHLRQALRLGAEGLRRNLILCVFPEGTRSIDGKLKKFRKGPGILAKELEVPAIPVAITGTYEALPRGTSKIRFHPVTVSFGKLLGRSSDQNTHDSLTEELFQSVNQLIRQQKKN